MVLESAPVDVDIVDLIRRVTDGSGASSATAPVALLDADVVATVAWLRERDIDFFNGSGRCIGIVPGGRSWFERVSCFRDQTGEAFSMQCKTQPLAAMFTGTTAVEVKIPPNGERIGSYNPPGRFLGPEGSPLGFVESSEVAGSLLVSLMSPSTEP